MSRRLEGDTSLLKDLPPVIATLVAEQECADNEDGGQSVNGSPLSDGDEPDGDDQPYDSDEVVAKIAVARISRRARHTSRMRSRILFRMPSLLFAGLTWRGRLLRASSRKRCSTLKRCFLLKSAFAPFMHAAAKHSSTCCAVLCLISPYASSVEVQVLMKCSTRQNKIP